MLEPLKVGLLGYGYWGKNFARNVAMHPELDLTVVADPSGEQRERAAAFFPQARVVGSADEVIDGDECEVVIIATPLDSHYEIARRCLAAGHHIVVTKPLCKTVREAEEVAELVESTQRVAVMDHTFVYTGAVQKARALIAQGELGDLIYCSSTRVNLGTYRRDSNVIWDLGPHDVSILDAIGRGDPVAVSATAGGRMGGSVDQIAHLSLFYADGFLAHVNLSWLAPVKMRLMLFGGSEKMLVYDDVEPSEKIKVYDKGMRFASPSNSEATQTVEYRTGDMWAPQLDQSEALTVELDHLIQCVRDGKAPVTGIDSAVNGVRILDAATRSATHSGELVILDREKWTGELFAGSAPLS